MEGREDVRQARKEAITAITRCISLLESKILDSIDRAKSNEPNRAEEGEQNMVANESPFTEQKPSAEKAASPNSKNGDTDDTPQQRHVSQLVITLQEPAAIVESSVLQ